MSNDTKADLIYAILAMDSYNRGYGKGITLLEEAGLLGNWGLRANSSVLKDANGNGLDFTAGFYAIAYKNATTNETVISYRGTDVKGLSASDTMGGSDPLNGYGLALGRTESATDVAIGTEQIRLATAFYNAVTGDNSGLVSVTGHSLGGGLAGYVSALTASQGILFDNMPFGVAARNRAAELPTLGLSQSDIDVRIVAQRGYFTLREFLAPVRSGELQNIIADVPLLGTLIQDSLDINGPELFANTAATEALVKRDGLDSHAGNDSVGAPFGLYHSMSLLTLLLWAKAEKKTDWEEAGEQLWKAYFNDDIAATINEANSRTVDGIGSAGGTLRTAIAYSAISEGDDEAKPFGDRGIWSIFDDAGDLGRVLARDDVSQVIRDAADGVAQMLVQYAGKLALGDIEKAQDSAKVESGILTASSNGGLLSIDLSDARWSHGAAHSEIMGRDALVDAVLKLLPRLVAGITAAEVERVVLASGTQGGVIDVSGSQATKTTITVGAGGADQVRGTSARDIMIGGGGAGDVLNGGAGNDWVLADGGERAITIGGSGRDWLYNSSVGGILYGDTVDGLDERGRVVYEESWAGKAKPGQLNGKARPTDVSQIEVSYYRYEADPGGGPDRRFEDPEARKSQSDNFWYAPDTTIMDAQHVDVLKFFGVPLTGGDAAATGVGLLLGALTTNTVAAGGILGAFNLGSALFDLRPGNTYKLGSVYYDTFLPNIAYTTQENADGGIDLLVFNELFPFIFPAFGKGGEQFYDYQGLDEDGRENNALRRTGIMRVKNFDMVNASKVTLKDGGFDSSLFSGFNSALLSGAVAASNDNEQGAWCAAALRLSVARRRLSNEAVSILRKAARWAIMCG